MANDKKFIAKNGFLTSDAESNFTNSTAATPTVTFTNSGGQGSSSLPGSGAVIAKFVGDSDAMVITNISGGDYFFGNNQQNNGINFYDGTGGMEFYYDGVEKFSIDSTGTNFATGHTTNGTTTTNRLKVEDNGSTSPLVVVKADDANPWALAIGNDTYSTTEVMGHLFYQADAGDTYYQSKGSGAYVNWNFQQHDGSTARTQMRIASSGHIELASNHYVLWGVGGTNRPGFVGDNTNKILQFHNNGAERMRLGGSTSSGYFGIGLAGSDPTSILHLKDSTGPGPTILLEDTSGGTQTAKINFDQSGQNTLTISTQYQSTSDDNLIQFAPADNIAMTIRGGTGSDDGNVGIGSNDPQYKLDVNGTSRVTGGLTVSPGSSGHTSFELGSRSADPLPAATGSYDFKPGMRVGSYELGGVNAAADIAFAWSTDDISTSSPGYLAASETYATASWNESFTVTQKGGTRWFVKVKLNDAESGNDPRLAVNNGTEYRLEYLDAVNSSGEAVNDSDTWHVIDVTDDIVTGNNVLKVWLGAGQKTYILAAYVFASTGIALPNEPAESTFYAHDGFGVRDKLIIDKSRNMTNINSVRFETPSTSGGNKNYFANIGTGGQDYWIMSTSDANGSLGGGKFAIGTDAVSGNNAAQTRLLIDSNGNVAIGTIASSGQHPDALIYVKGGISFEESTSASEGSVPAITQWSSNGTAQDLAIGTRSGTGNIRFFTGNAGGGGDWGASSNALRMAIDETGKVGIGTDNPTTELQVVGDVTAGRFIQSSLVGNDFYAASFSRSNTGIVTPDIWGTNNTFVIGTSSSTEAVGFTGANALFYGNIKTKGYFEKEYNSEEILIKAQDSGGTYSIYHTINDSQGNYNIMVGVDGAGQYTATSDGAAKILMQAHGTAGHVSLNAGPTGTAGNTVSYRIGLCVDGDDNAVYIGDPNDNIGLQGGSGYKLSDGNGKIYGSDVTGDTTYAGSGQIALKRSNNNPFLSFHSNDGSRNGYVQTIGSGAMVFQNDETGEYLFNSGTVKTDPSRIIIESTTQSTTNTGDMYGQIQFRVTGAEGVSASGLTGTEVDTVAMISAQDFRNGSGKTHEDSGLAFYTSNSGTTLTYRGGISNAGRWFVGDYNNDSNTDGSSILNVKGNTWLQGNVHVQSASNQVATFETTSTADMAIELKNSQGSMFFGLDGSENFGIGTDWDLNGANAKFTVTDTGRVGINKVSPVSNLDIRETGSYNILQMVGSGGNYTGIKLARGDGTWSSTSNNQFGMLVTDYGMEITKFTALGDNNNGRLAKPYMQFETDTADNVGIGTTGFDTVIEKVSLATDATSKFLINYTPLLLDKFDEITGSEVWGAVEPKPIRPSRIRSTSGTRQGSTYANSFGSTSSKVVGEADLSAIDADATFTFADCWAALEQHGARMPTLSEIMAGCGYGSGQGYDSEFLWTQTFAGPHHVWVCRGAYNANSAYGAKIVDITDPAEVYRTRGFFDASHKNMAVHYDNNESITTNELMARGDVTAYYSDERLKDFQGTIPDALEKVNRINGYLFTENELAKQLGYNNSRTQAGVSAQEIEAVLPEVVKEAPINEEKGTDYKTVQYDRLVPLLIEAVKELSAKVDVQQAEIDRLKGKGL